MEFWKYLTEGKGLLLPEELELPVEEMEKSEKKVSGKVPQPLYDTSNFPFVSSSQGSLGGQELVELGFGDTLGRLGQSYRGASSRDSLSIDQIGQKKHVDFGVSGSAVDSDCLEFATIDFKLGVLADCSSMGAGDSESSKDGAVFRSNMPAKRAQLMSSDSQICQVYGCNKDLSSSKGYYKRHKVCEDHTKTAIVIVKGIEQRFCQQCSRFHLLAEFDEGKRSCRKRLAHHNERRRKPRGTRFLSSSSTTRTSFLFQETLATAFSGPSKHESEIWSGHVKFEDPKLDSSSLLNFHDSIEETVGASVPSNTNASCIPDPSGALSLLSSQSQIIGPSGFHLSGKEGPSTTVASNGVSDDGVFNGLNTSDSKHFLSSGQGTMVDLSQLSSHLQMVEHKRNLMR